MSKSKLKVLVACEFSGIVRDAFIRKGHNAISCDLLPSESDFGPHHQGDVLDIINDGFDLMVAHPPCTYLSNAGAKHLYRGGKGELNMERYQKGLEAKDFFLALWNAPIGSICIENPMPSNVYNLPEKSQVIQPYEYGHPFQKRTYIWLKNLPALYPTLVLDTTESTRLAGNWFNTGGADRQKNRARTFRGIADAMADQWSDLH